jgi:hypothetical protein
MLFGRRETEKGRALLSGPGVKGYGRGRQSMPSSAGRRHRGLGATGFRGGRIFRLWTTGAEPNQLL